MAPAYGSVDNRATTTTSSFYPGTAASLLAPLMASPPLTAGGGAAPPGTLALPAPPGDYHVRTQGGAVAYALTGGGDASGGEIASSSAAAAHAPNPHQRQSGVKAIWHGPNREAASWHVVDKILMAVSALCIVGVIWMLVTTSYNMATIGFGICLGILLFFLYRSRTHLEHARQLWNGIEAYQTENTRLADNVTSIEEQLNILKEVHDLFGEQGEAMLVNLTETYKAFKGENERQNVLNAKYKEYLLVQMHFQIFQIVQCFDKQRTGRLDESGRELFEQYLKDVWPPFIALEEKLHSRFADKASFESGSVKLREVVDTLIEVVATQETLQQVATPSEVVPIYAVHHEQHGPIVNKSDGIAPKQAHSHWSPFAAMHV